MADENGGSGSLLISALTGAAIGAAGLTWWLLARAEQRQTLSQRIRQLGSIASAEPGSSTPLQTQNGSESLEERVQKLNLAIEDVRRQLEDLSPEING